jgi:putative ABC transport system permease protein
MAIVGVVEDSVYGSVRETIPPTAYIPLAQMAGQMPTWQVDIAVRSAVGAPASLTRAIAGAIGDVDANVSLTFRPLADRINASLLAERLVAMLSAFFGTLALLLAAIGLYGVLSYAISQRRAEIGIRMALGADAASVVRLVLGRVALLVGVGVVIGAAASLWASRFVGALLYGLERHDPLTFVAAAGVLVTVGALVAWWPARRATRIDPARVLRES